MGQSPINRKAKNTEQLLRKTLEGCESASAEIEIFSVSNKSLNPCKGCSACKTVVKCPIKDNITELLEKMKEADVIIMSSPIFFYDVTSQ